MILAKKMDQNHAKNNWIEQICNRLVQLSILIGVMQNAYFSQCYPSQDVESFLESDSSIQVQKIDEGWLFDSPGNQKALIFYPGAKVDTTSYAPLLKQIASNIKLIAF